MHDSTARLIGARETAHRLLYNADGIPKGWPDGAHAYRSALREMIEAVDEVLTIERYPVNPDVPEDGHDLRVACTPLVCWCGPVDADGCAAIASR